MALRGYGAGLLGLVAIKVLAPAFFARQDVRTPVRIAVGVLVATQLLNLVLVPRMGVIGAAIATTTSFGIGVLASIAMGRGIVAMPIPWSTLARCGLASGLMAGAVLLLPAPGGVLELGLKAGCGAVVYAAAAWSLNAAGVRDLAARLIAARAEPRTAP